MFRVAGVSQGEEVMVKVDPKYAKLVTVGVAVVLAVAGVYFPQYTDTLNTVIGLVIGRQFLLGTGHVVEEKP